MLNYLIDIKYIALQPSFIHSYLGIYIQYRYFKYHVCKRILDSHIFLISPKSKICLFLLILSPGSTTLLLNCTLCFLVSLAVLFNIDIYVITVAKGLCSPFGSRFHLMVLQGLHGIAYLFKLFVLLLGFYFSLCFSLTYFAMTLKCFSFINLLYAVSPT